MKNITLLSVLTIASAFAQQSKSEMADVHVSATARGFAHRTQASPDDQRDDRM